MHTPSITSVDLHDAPCLPLDVRSLTTSRAWMLARANPAIGFALVNLLMCAWHQIPAGSIPLDDQLLPIMAGVDAATWSVIRDDVLAEFALCTDGRQYHPAVVKQVELEVESREVKRRKSEAYSKNGRKSGEARAAAKAAAQVAITAAAAPAAPTAPAVPAKQAQAAQPTAERASVVLSAADPRQLSLIDSSDAVVVVDEVVTSANAPVAIAQAKGFKAKKGPSADEIESVYKHWLLVHKKRALLSPKRKAKIKTALENYPMAEVLAAVDGCLLSAHHQGENKHGAKYDDLELILRDPEHIEMFRDKTPGYNGGAGMRVVSAGTEKAMDEFDEYLRDKDRRSGVQGELT